MNVCGYMCIPCYQRLCVHAHARVVMFPCRICVYFCFEICTCRRVCMSCSVFMLEHNIFEQVFMSVHIRVYVRVHNLLVSHII
jgi:hypothetical protein